MEIGTVETVYTIAEIHVISFKIVVDDVFYFFFIVIDSGIGADKFHAVEIVRLCLSICTNILTFKNIVTHRSCTFIVFPDFTDDNLFGRFASQIPFLLGNSVRRNRRWHIARAEVYVIYPRCSDIRPGVAGTEDQRHSREYDHFRFHNKSSPNIIYQFNLLNLQAKFS